jgi:hypothetical protein
MANLDLSELMHCSPLIMISFDAITAVEESIYI